MPETSYAEPGDKLILVVDDDDDVQDLLSSVLRMEGFRIEQALDGEEALKKVQQLLPDLILMDLMFPQYGGHEIMIRLQSEATAEIPIIAITGFSKDKITEAAIRLEPNVVEFMQKPLRVQRLISMLHRILKTRPAKRAHSSNAS